MAPQLRGVNLQKNLSQSKLRSSVGGIYVKSGGTGKNQSKKTSYLRGEEEKKFLVKEGKGRSEYGFGVALRRSGVAPKKRQAILRLATGADSKPPVRGKLIRMNDGTTKFYSNDDIARNKARGRDFGVMQRRVTTTQYGGGKVQTRSILSTDDSFSSDAAAVVGAERLGVGVKRDNIGFALNNPKNAKANPPSKNPLPKSPYEGAGFAGRDIRSINGFGNPFPGNTLRP